MNLENGVVSEKEYNMILEALSEVYISMYVIDLEKDVLAPVKTNQHILKWADKVSSRGAQAQLSNVMEHLTAAADQVKGILEFVDLSTLGQRMAGKKSISTIFEGTVNGWCRASFIAIEYDENGTLCSVAYAVECVDEEKRRENQLLYMAQTDLMTGICNRGYGEKLISECLDQKINGAFGLFDIDHFKMINDTYGHKIGDLVLVAVAESLKRVVGSENISLRLGGDEFAFYIKNATKKSEVEDYVKRLFEEIGSIHIEPMEENIVISLGVSFYEDGKEFDDLYRTADEGVYCSKRGLKSTVTYC